MIHRYYAGSGGGSGSESQHTATEDPDTLTSKQYARLKDAICEGPIEGFSDPAHPLRCVYLDGTPIENPGSVEHVFHDGITTLDSTTFGSANGNLNAAMKGRNISGDNLLDRTTIDEVISETEARLSLKATATGTGKLWAMGGTLNVTNFDFYFVRGEQDQPYIPGFEAEETTIPDSFQIKTTFPWTSPVIADPAVDAIRLDIRFPRMTLQDKETGDVHGSTVQLAVDVQSNGGAYIEVINDTVVGKATEPYVRTYRVSLAEFPSPWIIRVRRITPNSGDSGLAETNETYFESYTLVTYGKLRHPNTAVVGVHIDAQNFSQIPTRAYHIKGLRVKIPVNYSPTLTAANRYASTGAGTTNGTWDGTFKTAWTNNPAWCWYDLATNKRYGLGKYLKAENIDKWTLYTIAKYCDELVPDGFGGQERRFTCNLYLQSREDAMKVLSDMAGIFRGMLYFANGLIVPTYDAPATTQHQFSPDNVINGQFAYSGTGRRARHTVAHVKWNDMNDVGKQKTEYVEDTDSLEKYGLQPLEIVGFGCTSRGQARRIGLWALVVEKILTDTVVFTTGLEGFHVRPGEVIDIQDPFRAGKTFSGRIVTATNNGNGTITIGLDKSINLAGGGYTVQFVNATADNVMVTTALNSAGDTSSLNAAWPPPSGSSALPLVGDVYMVASNTLVPQKFRVMNVTPKDKMTAEIIALQYNASVYDNVDFGDPLEIPPTSVLPDPSQVRPAGIVRVKEVLVHKYTHFRRDLLISWQRQAPHYYKGTISGTQNKTLTAAVDGPDFTDADIGRVIIDNQLDNDIISVGTTVANRSSATQVTLSRPATRAGAVKFAIERKKKGKDDPASYRVSYRYKNGNWIVVGDTQGTTMTLQDADKGLYRIRVIARQIPTNAEAAPSYASYEVVNPYATARITGLEIANSGNNTKFIGRDVHFQWRISWPSDASKTWKAKAGQGPFFAGYAVTIYNQAGGILQPEVIVQEPKYNFTAERNRANRVRNIGNPLAKPAYKFTIGVRVVDVFDNVSKESRLTVEKTSPNPPTGIVLVPGPASILIRWQLPADDSIERTEINRLAAPNVIRKVAAPGNNFVFDGLAERTGYTFQLRSVDVFGLVSTVRETQLSPKTLFKPEDVADVSMIPDGGKVSEGTFRVKMFCRTDGAKIYYTGSGAIPTEDTQLYLHGNPPDFTIAAGATKTIRARAFKRGESSNTITSRTFTASVTPVTLAPTFTPSEGEYVIPAASADITKIVTITAPEIDAKIRYSRNGTVPTFIGSLAGILVNSNTVDIEVSIGDTTVKAVAKRTGSLESTVSSGDYYITKLESDPEQSNTDPVDRTTKI